MKKNTKFKLLIIFLAVLTAGLTITNKYQHEIEATKSKISTVKQKKITSGKTKTVKTKKQTSPKNTDIKKTAQKTAKISKDTEIQKKQLSNSTGAIKTEKIKINPKWQYAAESKVNNGEAIIYLVSENGLNKTVCVNAGHGSSKSTKQYTFCNPAHMPKFVSGTTKKGNNKSVSASYGTKLLNGETEAQANLKVAMALKDKLLKEGYNVLMIRENNDVDLDNIARTVLANQKADIHVSIHFDSTANDKGAFCINVPDIAAYKNMEPVKSMWQQDNRLAESIVRGLQSKKVKIFQNGFMPMDLTQTSYSTVPTTDIELGDRKTATTPEKIDQLANGVVEGINIFFSENK